MSLISFPILYLIVFVISWFFFAYNIAKHKPDEPDYDLIVGCGFMAMAWPLTYFIFFFKCFIKWSRK